MDLDELLDQSDQYRKSRAESNCRIESVQRKHGHQWELSDNSLIFASFWDMQLVCQGQASRFSPGALWEGGGRTRAEEGDRVLKAQLGDLIKHCPKYLTYDTQQTLRPREEKLTNSIYCMSAIYKEALLFGQFYVSCDAWSLYYRLPPFAKLCLFTIKFPE